MTLYLHAERALVANVAVVVRVADGGEHEHQGEVERARDLTLAYAQNTFALRERESLEANALC